MRRKFILMVRFRIQFLFVAVRNGHRNRCDMWFPDSVCCCVAQSPARMLHTHYGYLLFQSCQCWWQQKQPIHRCQESNGRSIFDRTILIILTFNLRPFVYPSLSISLPRLRSIRTVSRYRRWNPFKNALFYFYGMHTEWSHSNPHATWNRFELCTDMVSP